MSEQLTQQFDDIKKIILIGGGDLMATTATLLREKGFNCQVIVAPRHINESLPLLKTTLKEYLHENEINCHVLSDINDLSQQALSSLIGQGAMAMCFGPAWVFSAQVIDTFDHSMFNINAIPIPHYLGGAHYTWQLLNRNHEGGCFFQEITPQIDRGDILDRHLFSISSQAKTPHDYFIENYQQGLTFIKALADKFLKESAFTRQPYREINDDRLYLPRLRTDKQGFINWQWTVDDVVSFCQGFDSPYIGAATFVNDQLIRLKGMSKNNIAQPMHPFCIGLIVRKTDKLIIVAAKDGFIEIKEALNEQGVCIKSTLKEGMRLHTPANILDEALSYQTVISATGFKD